MSLVIKSVSDKDFVKYGRVVDGYDFGELLSTLEKCSPKPDDVVYVPSCPELEAVDAKKYLSDNVYGGMPIQIGYCNGNNHKLNAVEYHRDSEINIPLEGAIFILGSEQDVEDDFTYDTSRMEAFEAPAGAVLEFYGTTLHYAPCNAVDKGFRVVVVLPKGTNTDAPQLSGKYPEDRLLTARNKWLIAHEESGLGADGAFVGLKGENLTV